MAAIALPTCPMPTDAQMFLRDFGGTLTPFLGGPEQQINRLGTRFGVRYTMPPMDGQEAREFVARLTRGRSSRVLMPWPVTDFDPGSPGAPKVNSAATGGTALSVKGLTPGYVLREGQFFSLIHSARRYVYMVTADATANASGIAAVGIFPQLRTAASVDDVLEVAEPMIEGRVLPGEEWAWTLSLTLETGIAFSVVESK